MESNNADLDYYPIRNRTMKLIFTDAKTHEVVVNIDVKQIIDDNFSYYVVDFDSSVYKTYDFMIDCALYGLNEGQVTSDTYNDDEDEPLANWALLDDCAFAYSNKEGFHVDFYDGDIITHDEQYKTWNEVLEACETYILAGLFDKEMFCNAWEHSSYNLKNKE